jgi:hypothetical protein
MSTEMSGRKDLHKKLDAIGWGAFFVWMGLTMLIKFPAGVTAVGIGIIILAESVVRLVLGVSVNAFWILMGAIFLAAGIAELSAVNFPLLPVAFLIVGVLLIVRQTTKARKTE